MNRYSVAKVIKTFDNPIRRFTTVKYPSILPSSLDIYVYTTQGDRFDVLAQQYYGDSSLWWVISIANTAVAGTDLPSDLPQNTLVIPEGLQIRIPANYSTVVNAFNAINS